MSTFPRLVSVVRYLVLAGRGSVARGFGGSAASAFGLLKAGALSGGIGRRAAVLGVTVAAALALGSGSASAAITHRFLFSFDGSGTPAGSFSPFGVAVDNSSGAAAGKVYVTDDSAPDVVDRFSGAGSYDCQITGAGTTSGTTVSASECDSATAGTPKGSFASLAQPAVDPATGDVWVPDGRNHVLDEFGPDGAFLAELVVPGSGSPQAVALDSSGDLLVADSRNRRVEEYDPSVSAWSTFATGTSFGGFSSFSLSGVAVDLDASSPSFGDVYVADGSPNDVVDVFSSSGSFLRRLTGTPRGSFGTSVNVAVDPTSGELYVSDLVNGVVDEFGPTGAFETQIQLPQGSSSFGPRPRAVAIDASTGNVYVSDQTNRVVDVFGPDEIVPDVTASPATNVDPTSATLNGAVNPDGLEVTDCHFDWGTSTAYGNTAPCAETVGSGTANVPVHADLTGLTPGTTYHFRLVASNASGTNVSDDASFSTPPPPTVSDARATNVSASSADLDASINPEGNDTSYHLEWGTSTSYGNNVPVPDADIGSGTSDVAISQHITGLRADTTYHWRVVAQNIAGTTTSPDHTLIYDTSGGGLPDNRAYEQVTPVDKNGAVIGAGLFIGAPDVAGSGQRVLAASIQCFGDTASCNANRLAIGGEGAMYSFERTPAGWRTTPLSPPATEFDSNNNSDWHADPRAALFSATGAPGGKDQLVARRPDGSLAVIGPVEPPTADASGPPYFVFGDRDFSHVVFGDVKADLGWSFDSTLTEGQHGTAYEYVGTGNSQPLLVGVTGGRASTDLVSQCGISLNGISRDGRTVFFSATGHEQLFLCPSSATAPPATELLARIDESRTVLLSASSPSDCTTAACQSSAPEPAVAQGVAQDGSAAAFSSTQQLTDDATQGNRNLYVYDFTRPSGHELVDVSAGDTSGTGPDFSGAVAMSPEGSHLYFVARGVLTARRNAFGQAPTAGANNLYVYTREANSAGEHVAFLASLPDSDSGLWSGGLGDPRAKPLANVTPDGRFLVFPAHGRLTPDDVSVSGAAQVFRYDALTGQLARVSIGERGFNDNGNAGSRELCADNASDCTADAHVAPVPLSEERLDPTVSDDGRYVVFQSPAGLTPQALDYVANGTDSVSGATQYAQNVYEWEQAGAGSCPATRSSGCVSLISDGKDTSRLVLLALAIDASGSNIFFSTVDPLVPQDTDGGQLDIYDARICTQSDPCIKPPPPPSSCDGDACQGTPSPPPPPSLAASVSFFGAGNASQPAGARVLTRTVRGARFLVRVRVPAKGRITIAGNGIRRVSRLVSQAGTYRLRVNLTPTARRALARRQRLRLRLRVTYVPGGGSTRTATVPLTVRPALRHRARHSRRARGATDTNRRAGK